MKNVIWQIENGTAIAIPDLACVLQLASRSIFEAKLCKGGKQQ
jgi:hypothetical protein